jgi:hypothetical protein
MDVGFQVDVDTDLIQAEADQFRARLKQCDNASA